jgi:hypothetical protein
MFIAKGATDAVHYTQIGSVDPHWVDHAPSGWQTEGCFMRYLDQLSAAMGGQPFHLISDQCSAHKSAAVQAHCAGLGIELHLIPTSLTDKLQPLDRRVFGALKANAKSHFRRAIREQRQAARNRGERLAEITRT